MEKRYMCPVMTLFDEDNQIDWDSQKALYDSLLAAGIRDIVLLGSAGEFYALSKKEAYLFVDKSLAYLKNKCNVLVGTTLNSLVETIEFSNHVLHGGASAVMLLGEYYIGVTQEGMLTYFNQAAAQIEGDIYIYNYPDRTGFDMKVSTLKSLLSKHQNIVGIKDTVSSVIHTENYITHILPEYPKFEILSGFDANFASVVLSGGCGCIAAMSNFRPELCIQWLHSYNEEDWKTFSKIKKQINEYMEIYEITTPFMPGMKYIMSKESKGKIPIQCRTPALAVTDQDIDLLNKFIIKEDINDKNKK